MAWYLKQTYFNQESSYWRKYKKKSLFTNLVELPGAENELINENIYSDTGPKVTPFFPLQGSDSAETVHLFNKKCQTIV